MIGTQVLALAVSICTLRTSNSLLWDIPVPDSLQECYNRVQSTNVDSYVGSIYSWHCEHHLAHPDGTDESTPQDPQVLEYIKNLYDKAMEVTPSRKKRQATTRCTRKEYRMLTLEERTRYHNAINALKRNTSVRPNRYDALANIHVGVNNLIAHGGPGFLGWHRIYLLMYEAALREVEPTVCVPYWDSSLDSQLPNPLSSTIWTPEYLGTPQGAVTAGPFANWRLPSGVQLIRNAGVDGDLISTTDVADILSRTRHEEIVTPTSTNPRYNIEQVHGTVHVYIGGAMNRLDTAAFDPVFFMHHAFIDYIWERFRARIRALGVDPTTYPRVNSNPRHAATAPTRLLNTRQVDGFNDTIANRVTYEPVPTCSASSPSCGDRFLVCQVSTGRCLPSTTTTRARRSVPAAADVPNSCDRPTYGMPVQNDYCCVKGCDTNQWAMIPVRIVNVRPPKFKQYGSYPVTAGNLEKQRDIYSPSATSNTNKYIRSKVGNPKTYARCENDTPAGQVFLSSAGINYSGYYKESAIVDQRLAVSVSVGFVGIKKPSPGEAGITKALLRAHDSCGRVCRVGCKEKSSKDYKPCSGAVALSDQSPLMYGDTYDDAVMSVFDYATGTDLPKFRLDDISITFFCDYHDGFPYAHTGKY